MSGEGGARLISSAELRAADIKPDGVQKTNIDREGLEKFIIRTDKTETKKKPAKPPQRPVNGGKTEAGEIGVFRLDALDAYADNQNLKKKNS